MELNNKNINILKTAAEIIWAATLWGLNLTEYWSGGAFLPFIIGCVFIEMIARSLKAKFDPEGLQREEKGNELLEAQKQKVKVPFTLAGIFCDIVTIAMLIVSWTLMFKRHLLDTDDVKLISIAIVLTVYSLAYIGMTYYPKTIGGIYGVLGMEQVNQLILRDHAISFTAALTLLGFVFLINTSLEWLPWTLLAIGVVLILSKMLIKRPEIPSTDLQSSLKAADQNKNDFDLKKVKIGRTREGTLLEAIAALLLIAAWIIAFAKHEFSGGFEHWPIGTILCTIAIIALLITAYERPFGRLDHKDLTNARVVALSVRRTRVGAIVWAFLVLCNQIWDFSQFPHPAYWLIPIAIFLIPDFIFGHFISKAKKNE